MLSTRHEWRRLLSGRPARAGGDRATLIRPPRAVSGMSTTTTSASTTALADAERIAADTLAAAKRDDGRALAGRALLRRLSAVYTTSGACGARIHSQTGVHRQRDGGVEFVLRVLPSLRAKPEGQAAPAAAAKKDDGSAAAGPPAPPANTNPFLPYDERLFVSNLSPTHCLLLNKFDVAPLHSLVVTRAFAPQTDPLRAADLEATWAALGALSSSSSSSGAAAAGGGGALAFYNCGEHSGRSQPHKHVQVVPLPFADDAGGEGAGGGGGGEQAAAAAAEAPIDSIVRAALARRREGEPFFELRDLPFRAYAAPAPPVVSGAAAEGETNKEQEAAAAASLERSLAAMVARCAADCAPAASPSYNLLLTGGWAVAVPRRAERDRPLLAGADSSSSPAMAAAAVKATRPPTTVAVNALGFAGTLLCKSEQELAHAQAKGPMAILADAGWPW